MSDDSIQILLVDDDPLTTTALAAGLEHLGTYRTHAVSSGEAALDSFGRSTWDAIATDLMMPGIDGIELIRKIRASDPSIPLFLFTGSASIRKAVEGIQAGATDFMPKPVDVESFHILLERAIRDRSVLEEVARARERREGSGLDDLLAGDHPHLDRVRSLADRVARMPRARVLLTGESGTGKSLLARAIHDRSDARGRFVSVNCAALPAQLLESELFGHEKGAFTDAREMKRGLIELAHGGTLFLDEIGAMPVELQGKLLLFLEEREIRRVGGTDSIPVSTHIIAATNEDLNARVEERKFRADLLYRLDVASIELPSLRKMPEVIPQLAARFVHEICEEARLPLPEMDSRSFDRLHHYPWPGNARELRNAVERALIFRDPGVLRVSPPAPRSDAPSDPALPSIHLPLDLTMEEVERRYLSAILETHADRELQETAEALGISRKSLWERRKRWDL